MSDEQTLRRLLWLIHGCPLFDLYGDDGEMQCGACMIDFKRDSPETIERKLFRPLPPILLPTRKIKEGPENPE